MKFRPQIQLRFRHEPQFVQVKQAAASEAVSVNEWVLHKIELHLNGGGMADAGSIKGSTGGVVGVPRERMREIGAEAPVTTAGSSPARSTKPSGRHANVNYLSESGGRPIHDSATCQLRGCGMCKVLGVKDAGRGLK